jgi:hypothetical protein
MTLAYVKSKRTALSWDPEFKPNLPDLENFLAKILEKNSVTNTEIFMLCLGIGFNEGLKRDVPPRKSDAVRLSYLKEGHMAIVKSVAISDTKDDLVLLDEDKIYDIAEQYAATGLMMLSRAMKSEPDFTGWLTALLFNQAKEVGSLS